MPAHYEVDDSIDGQYFWKLIAANGEPLCHSELYTKRSDAGRGIRAAIRASLEAAIEITLERTEQNDDYSPAADSPDMVELERQFFKEGDEA